MDPRSFINPPAKCYLLFIVLEITCAAAESPQDIRLCGFVAATNIAVMMNGPATQLATQLLIHATPPGMGYFVCLVA